MVLVDVQVFAQVCSSELPFLLSFHRTDTLAEARPPGLCALFSLWAMPPLV